MAQFQNCPPSILKTGLFFFKKAAKGLNKGLHKTEQNENKLKKPPPTLIYLRYIKALNLIFHQLRNLDRGSLLSLKNYVVSLQTIYSTRSK